MARRKGDPDALIAELARSSMLLVELEDHLRAVCRAARLFESDPQLLKLLLDQVATSEQLIAQLEHNRTEGC